MTGDELVQDLRARTTEAIKVVGLAGFKRHGRIKIVDTVEAALPEDYPSPTDRSRRELVTDLADEILTKIAKAVSS